MALTADQRPVQRRAGHGDIAVDGQKCTLGEALARERDLFSAANNVEDDVRRTHSLQLDRAVASHGELPANIDEEIIVCAALQRQAVGAIERDVAHIDDINLTCAMDGRGAIDSIR